MINTEYLPHKCCFSWSYSIVLGECWDSTFKQTTSVPLLTFPILHIWSPFHLIRCCI